MYLWRKRTTAKWLRNRTENLRARFGGQLAIVELPGKARTLVEVCFGRRIEAKRLEREFGGTIEKLRADWLQQFARESRAKPLRIGSRLIITRDANPADKRTVVIPAAAAFGTGEHATTAMCLRILERATRNVDGAWTMLDAGTGSGILAVAGTRFGAKRIVAIDNDPLACSIARRNARANRAGKIEFRTGDILKEKLAEKFDVITANLFSEILFKALPAWSRRLASDGALILSGVLRSQEPSLVRALRRNGFAPEEIRRRGKWVALLAFRTRKRS
ncbi:MAG TPA: 50S ribosomal protein L11 methyltransferase [Chthoniobacterales bacterium]|nr:50S ribosomal protein L11 methyltransferase [Chthoniobacterales bacterium]